MIAGESIKVTVKTPADLMRFSRGFYQVEEDILYIPIFPGGRFFSFLDSAQITIDVDRKGRLLFIQVMIPRRQWRIRRTLKPPDKPEPADIRFLGFRDSIPPAQIESTPDHSCLRILFAHQSGTMSYGVAEHLIFDVTADGKLSTIWLTAVGDDRAARGMAAWRRQMTEASGEKSLDPRFERIEVKK